MTEEQILTYEQFYKMYKAQSPEFSLLFDTGKGYFACCISTSEATRHKGGISAVTESAVAEIESRMRHEPPLEVSEAPFPPDAGEPGGRRKKRILVVDDSLTIRESIKRLLEPDYEVAMADSGVAAIRTITLNRPDLVLLDYEMPVCDGRQTLEMLRSDPVFADLPVIFLTGRRDTDSMIKVMPLKCLCVYQLALASWSGSSMSL